MFNSIWYQNLTKPPFSPSSEIFTPVWLGLYFAIFLSLILYIFADKENKIRGYIYFAIQLCLNLFWIPAFFILQNIFLALIVLLLLDRYVYLTIKEFFEVSKIATLFIIPYFLWCLFATYLNFAYLILN